MTLLNQLKSKLAQELAKGEAVGFNPYYHPLASPVNGIINIEGQQFYNLASNNYLGLANHPKVVTAMKGALDEYGASLCGTPVASGYSKLYEEVSTQFEKWLSLDQVHFFPSGYQANTAILSSLLAADGLAFIDHYAHASLVEGVRFSKSVVRPFKSNNLKHLEKQLQVVGDERFKLIVTESVFSTTGKIAPLQQLQELADRYQALLFVDDSHGLGAIGKSGKGVLEYSGLEGSFQGLYTASLGKAMGVSGGLVGGSKELMEVISYYCSGLVYSTALPPVILAGIQAAIKLIQKAGEVKISKLYREAAYLRKELLLLGYELVEGEAPIVSLRFETEAEALFFSKQLFAKGVFTTTFLPPSVPKGAALIRLIPGILFNRQQLETIIAIFKEVKACV